LIEGDCVHWAVGLWAVACGSFTLS
jgi:hypothetical protein